jgi:Predicted hydrolases of the HAD superfamily
MKALFFDIDGTLVSTVNHRIPQSAIDALLEAHEKGHKLFISTGRTILQFPYLDDLPFDGYITLNGAFECTGGLSNPKGGQASLGTAKEIYSQAFPQSIKDRIADYQDGPDKFPMLIMSESLVTMNYIDDEVIAFNKLVDIDATKIRLMGPRERVKYTVHQFCAFIKPEREKDLADSLFADCDLSRWNRYFMFEQVVKNRKEGGKFAGCNFWGWGGFGVPRHTYWELGDDYLGDPAQEQQGLNTVFVTDSSTVHCIEKYTSLLK